MASDLATKWAERMVNQDGWNVDLRIGNERATLEDDVHSSDLASELGAWRLAFAVMLDAFHAEALAEAAPPTDRAPQTYTGAVLEGACIVSTVAEDD